MRLVAALAHVPLADAYKKTWALQEASQAEVIQGGGRDALDEIALTLHEMTVMITMGRLRQEIPDWNSLLDRFAGVRGRDGQ
jgi:hypothetical protein